MLRTVEYSRFAFFELTVQPDAPVCPVPLRRPERQTERVCRLLHAQTGEESQLDEFCNERVADLEFPQGVIQPQKLITRESLRRHKFVEGNRLPSDGVTTIPLASLFNQDPPHRLGGGEEVPPALPRIWFTDVHKSEVGLMDQGSGLEGLAGLLLGQLLSSQFAQLIIDQRQELVGRLRVTLLNR